MSDIPVFRLYGDGNPEIEERLQPTLALRSWSGLTEANRNVILQELFNRGWIGPYSKEVLSAVNHLNRNFLRDPPGKRLHRVKPEPGQAGGSDYDRLQEAYADFREIVQNSKNEDIVLRMLSAFASAHIWWHMLESAKKESDNVKRRKYVDDAYEKFDRLASLFNYIFRQFALDLQLTRNGLIPVQDQKIAETIYAPVLAALSDPKYIGVSDDLAKMFADYRAENYGEVITKAHSAVQRFLQIHAGEEGSNGKGELRELFRAAKAQGLVSSTRFGEPLIKVLEGFFPSERATNSTAKPALSEATARDAMLMMDLVMVFLKHCLAA